MRREIQSRHSWQKVCLILLLGLVISLRAIGPLGTAPTQDGYVAICAGGTIVYVPAAEIGLVLPAEEAPETIEDRCPWFGFGTALAVVSQPDGPPFIAAVPSSLTDISQLTDPVGTALHANQPRAPPLG